MPSDFHGSTHSLSYVYLHIYIHVCIHTHSCTCVYTHAYLKTHIQACTHACTHTHVCVHTHTSVLYWKLCTKHNTGHISGSPGRLFNLVSSYLAKGPALSPARPVRDSLILVLIRATPGRTWLGDPALITENSKPTFNSDCGL